MFDINPSNSIEITKDSSFLLLSHDDLHGKILHRSQGKELHLRDLVCGNHDSEAEILIALRGRGYVPDKMGMWRKRFNKKNR